MHSPNKNSVAAQNSGRDDRYVIINKSILSKTQSLPSLQTRVVKSDFLGKKFDSITESMAKPAVEEPSSIYQKDYSPTKPTKTHGDDSSVVQSVTNVRLPSRTATNETANLGEAAKQESSLAGERNNYTSQPGSIFGSPRALARDLKPSANYTLDNWEPTYKLEKKRNVLTTQFKGSKSSLYKADFVQHNYLSPTASLKPDLYGASTRLGAIDFKTTNRADFKDWRSLPPERAKDNSRIVADIPFVGGTSYRNQYVDWGPNSKTYERPKAIPTVVADVPFRGNSIYNESFHQNGIAKKAEPFSPKKGSPLLSSVPFLGQTSYKSSFTPFKVSANNITSSPSKANREYVPTVSFEGNYKSLFQEEYTNPMSKVYVGPSESQQPM